MSERDIIIMLTSVFFVLVEIVSCVGEAINELDPTRQGGGGMPRSLSL